MTDKMTEAETITNIVLKAILKNQYAYDDQEAQGLIDDYTNWEGVDDDTNLAKDIVIALRKAGFEINQICK